MEAKLYLWTKIKKLNLDFFMKLELFEIIDKYLEQVQFVTGIVKNECNLFLAERNSNYEQKTFLLEKADDDQKKEVNFIRLMRKVKKHLQMGGQLYITIGFQCEYENQLVYFPDWYKGQSFEKEVKQSTIDYAFNDIIYVLEKDKRNKKINQLLSKKGVLTKAEKMMLVDLSSNNKEKALV